MREKTSVSQEDYLKAIWELVEEGHTPISARLAEELSVTPPLLAQLKFLVRRLKLTEAKELAEFALACESPSEILARCQTLAQNTAPSLFETKK